MINSKPSCHLQMHLHILQYGCSYQKLPAITIPEFCWTSYYPQVIFYIFIDRMEGFYYNNNLFNMDIYEKCLICNFPCSNNPFFAGLYVFYIFEFLFNQNFHCEPWNRKWPGIMPQPRLQCCSKYPLSNKLFYYFYLFILHI